MVARISNFTLAPEGNTTVAEDSRNTRQTESTQTASSASTLVATFTVKGVPINTKGFDPNIVDPLSTDKQQGQLSEADKIKNATQNVVTPNNNNTTGNTNSNGNNTQQPKTN